MQNAGSLETLDEEETLRLRGFSFEADRARFLSAHTRLRSILGAYRGVEPGSLRFRKNSFGKPELEVEGGDLALCFNLTHTRHFALLAVSPGFSLGIDLEEIATIEPEVAENYFSAAELAQLSTLEGSAWQHGFYRCWTQKEAILKAEGVGLNLDLCSFDVSLLPEEPVGLIAARTALRCQWKLFDLSPGTGMVSALASENPQAKVRCFQLAMT